MRQIRIYTPQPLENEAEILLDARAEKHLIQVLRKRSGDAVTLFNGNGWNAHGVIIKAGARADCLVKINRTEPSSTESPLKLGLIQAVAKGDKMDWLVQKAIELGVAEIRPVWTERTEVRLNEQRAAKRQARWQEIAISACEQSLRSMLPTVHGPVALTTLEASHLRGVFLHPQASGTLADWKLPTNRLMQIAIGPEGGFSDYELDWLGSSGMIGLRIGPRVLRTETAGPAALAALQALHGDWR
ncbi:MAG: 16S rRNA (uracil(1498)-N(3))-methyltransferase [Pseudomonadota bacterium]